MAAFIDRRFVWLAMFSRTALISKRPSDSRAISCISAAIACRPDLLTSEACARRCTLPELTRLILVTESMLASICSMALEDWETLSVCISISSFSL
ncbi:hypothetical protein FACS1894161_2010 [Spirochaetia bacterium]|nr:hypothetical protein FACS1894161_2010 [Spirochaetia bacterium]